MEVLARKSALAYKAQTNNIVVVEDFTFEAPKTKEFVNVVNNLMFETLLGYLEGGGYQLVAVLDGFLEELLVVGYHHQSVL